MFSTMITDESTMMPKSTAPIDSKLADLPRRKSIAKANSRASGTLMATITAVRTLLRNISSTTVTRAMPDQQVLLHGFGGDVDQGRAVVEYVDLHAGQHAAGLSVQLARPGPRRLSGPAAIPRPCATARWPRRRRHHLPSGADRGRRTRRCRRHPSCGWLSSTCPSRVWWPTTTPCRPGSRPGRSGPPSTTSSTRTGTLSIEASTIWRISRMRRSSSPRSTLRAAVGSCSAKAWSIGSRPRPIRPSPRTTSTASPAVTYWPPMLLLAVETASFNCWSVIP